MSQDFGIDNAGSGFDFGDDDDDDLEAMFNRANEGEETGDDDTHLAYIYDEQDRSTNSSSVAQGQYSDEEESVSEESVSQNDWDIVPQQVEYEQKSEVVNEKIPTYDDTTTVPENVDYRNFEEYKSPDDEVEQQQDYVSPEPEPIPVEPVLQPASVQERRTGKRISSNYNSAYSSHSVASAPQAPEPVEVPAPAETAPKRFNITTEKEDVESVRKTIRILDAYRKLSSKTIVAQLIYNENDVDPQDEAALVVRVLRADPMLGRMMTVLRESASEKDRVERVFYILNTDQDVLRYLGSFLETVSDVTFDKSQHHIAFAKEVERTIEGLDNKIVQHVADAQSVLVAAENEKE